MAGNSFIVNLRDDRLDDTYATDAELAEAVSSKADSTALANYYVKNTVDTKVEGRQIAGDYATNTNLGTKADKPPSGETFAFDSAVNTKQDLPPENDSFVLTTTMNTGMATKQDNPPTGENFAFVSAVNTKQDLPPENDSFVLTTTMNTGMATKQDNPPENDSFVLTTTMNTGMNTKQDNPPTGETFAYNSAVDAKQDKPSDATDSYVLTTTMNTNLSSKQDNPPENESFALVSDIPALSGGYTTSQIDDKFALKQDTPDLSQDPDNRFVARNEVYLTNEIDTNHYTKDEIDTNHYTKNESDGNYLGSVTIGTVSTVPPIDLNTGLANPATVTNSGTGNTVVLDFQIPQGVNGAPGAPGAPGANGANGADGEDGEDGSDGAAGAAAVVSATALLGAVGNYYQTNSLPTAQDFSDATTSIDNKVAKPDDWNAMNNPNGTAPETTLNPHTLDAYVTEKVRIQNNINKATILNLGKNAINTKVNINSKNTKITSDGVLITQGTNDLPDSGYKFQVEGDTKMLNGTNKYLDLSTGRVGVRGDADHLLDGCDIKLYGDTCVTGDLMVSGTLKNGSGVSYVTTNDTSGFATTSSVSTLSTALSTLQTSVGNNSGSLASKADLSSIYTQNHIDTNFQTVAPSGKSYAFDTDLTNFITASDVPDISGKQDVPATGEQFALVSQLPDISGKQNVPATGEQFALVSTLANYDTSSQVDTKIANSSGGSSTSSHTIDTNSAITGVRTYLRTLRLPEIDPFYPDDPYSITQQSVSFLIPNVSYTKEELIEIFFNKIDEILASTASTNSFSYTYHGVWKEGANYVMEITLPYFAYGTQMVVGSGTSDLGVGFEVDMPTSLRNIFGLGSTTYRFVNLTGSAGQPATAIHRLTIPINITSNGTDDAIFDEVGGLLKYGTGTTISLKDPINFGKYVTGGREYASHSGYGGTKDWYIRSGLSTGRVYIQDSGGEVQIGTGGNASYARYSTNKDWYIRSESGGKVVLQDGVTGNVGVGQANPRAKFEVLGSAGSFGWGTAAYLRWNSDQFNYGYNNGAHFSSVCIYANEDILCGGYIGSYSGTITASDERIKKEIVDVEDDSALETLRLLKPKKYKYVDQVKRGSEPVWGFIAQEVRDTVPYATELRTECLPNIYELANVSDSNVITFTNFDTSTLESNAMVLKVYDTKNTEHLVNIAEVIDTHSIRVNEDLSEWTGSVDETGNVVAGNQLFVYGEEVNDFVFLKKDAIFTISTSALQELDRQLQSEKARNDTLEARLLALEEKI